MDKFDMNGCIAIVVLSIKVFYTITLAYKC